MTRKLIEQILDHVAVENFSLLLYGSSSLNIFHGRDIDSIVISPDINDVCHAQFEVNLRPKRKICNLYLVPNHIYLNDVYNLTYGGYYSHKFAISFKEILSKGISLDAPLAFWLNEYKLYCAVESNVHNPETFIKFVHYKIVKYRPTFIHPLLKFISNFEQIKYLNDYILTNIININLSTNGFVPDFIYKTLNENQEKALFNFWSEYNKHKNKSSFWGENTFMKMKLSYENIDFSLIKQYFNLQ